MRDISSIHLNSIWLGRTWVARNAENCWWVSWSICCYCSCRYRWFIWSPYLMDRLKELPVAAIAPVATGGLYEVPIWWIGSRSFQFGFFMTKEMILFLVKNQYAWLIASILRDVIPNWLLMSRGHMTLEQKRTTMTNSMRGWSIQKQIMLAYRFRNNFFQ